MLTEERPPKGRTTNAKLGPHRLGYLVIAVLLVLIAAGSACRRAVPISETFQRIDSSGPPFVAKEPLQYRATRVTNSGLDATTATTEQTGIARDGARRRMDVKIGGEDITLLELPEGRVLISQTRAVFARLRADESAGLPVTDDGPLSPDLSPERLVNQDNFEPEYHQLRTEQLNGRATTVYQVTLRTGTDRADTTIWIDDETGFPLKSEMTGSVGEVPQPAVYRTEIRDLILGPPPAAMFELPPGLREVGSADFWRPSNVTVPMARLRSK